MFCSNCGKQVDDNVKFCPFCGSSMRTDTTGKQNTVKNSVPKRGLAGKIVIVLLLITLFVAGGIVISLFSGSAKSSEKAEIESGGPGNTEVSVDSENKENKPVANESSEQVDEQESDSYLALVRNQDGKYGYINEEGEEVIACQYDIAYGFAVDGSELAVVGEKNGTDGAGNPLYKWGYINRKGELVIPMQYDAVSRFAHDNIPLLAVAKQIGFDEKGNQELIWGFIDKQGNAITEYEYVDRWDRNYDYLYVSETGMINVIRKSVANVWEYGVINTKGEVIIPFGKYEEIFCEKNDLILVKKKTSVDEDGEPIYKWGCIDKEENVIIPFEYEHIGVLMDSGLRVARKINRDGECKYGYIDEKGEERIPFKFEHAESFYNGLAAVYKEVDYDEYLGFINEQGELVIPYQYQSCHGQFDGNQRAIIWRYTKNAEGEYEDNYGLINSQGDEILPIQYAKISQLSLELYGFKDGEHYGCIDRDGKVIIPVKYDMMERAGSNGWIVAGTYNGKYDEDTDEYRCQYMDGNGNVMLQLPEKYIYAEGFVKE